jgi:hypothetical protein
MKPLNLHEAYKLYLLIKPISPETKDLSRDLLEFIAEFFQNMMDNSPNTLRDILRLFSDKETDTIIESGQMAVLEIILEGFVANRIVSLVEFFDGVIYG